MRTFVVRDFGPGKFRTKDTLKVALLKYDIPLLNSERAAFPSVRHTTLIPGHKNAKKERGKISKLKRGKFKKEIH